MSTCVAASFIIPARRTELSLTDQSKSHIIVQPRTLLKHYQEFDSFMHCLEAEINFGAIPPGSCRSADLHVIALAGGRLECAIPFCQLFRKLENFGSQDDHALELLAEFEQVLPVFIEPE